jgi:hypothetical protein
LPLIAFLTLLSLLLCLPQGSFAQQAPQPFGLGVIAGGGSYTDSGGNRWNADQPYSQGSWGYMGGRTYSNGNSIASTADGPLYQSERYGNFSYKFDVPNGVYNVTLHFAEIYWKNSGERIFDVTIEGSRVLDRYDICAAVGCNTALALTFLGVQVQDGQLNIDFVNVKDNAKVSAISITSSVSSPPPPAIFLTSPTVGTNFSPGQVVTATGSGQNLRWDIDRTNDGLPSFATGQGNSITFTVPANSNESQFIRITLMGDSGTATRDYSIFVPPPPPPPAPPFSMGPLKVHSSNPRYFMDGSGKAVYLTGSNLGWELQDDAWGEKVTFDFASYLKFLTNHNHNLIRLWMVENTRLEKGRADALATPMPYKRTGLGNALDGGLKFDLNQLNQAYFDRLRSRIIEARNRGIYVMVMLFQGFSSDHLGGDGRDDNPWFGHPFNANNNVNGINGDPNGDGLGREIHSLAVPAIIDLQKKYVKKVIDTVNDLDNVLYEICNECRIDNHWQYEMINTIHNYEATKPRQHPVVMSVSWSEGIGGQDTADLFASPAEAIAPGTNPDDYEHNPPPADGAKVVISDSDHINWRTNNPQLVWKNFLRGNNPIILDNDLVERADTDWEPIRWAMGHTRSYADKMNMAAVTPRGNLSSTGYALAHPGQEYLVYAPSGGDFTVNLSGSSQNFRVEWFNPATGISSNGGSVAGGAKRSFSPPFSGDAVLYLKADGI